jgi:hypothetical protein
MQAKRLFIHVYFIDIKANISIYLSIYLHLFNIFWLDKVHFHKGYESNVENLHMNGGAKSQYIEVAHYELD